MVELHQKLKKLKLRGLGKQITNENDVVRNSAAVIKPSELPRVLRMVMVVMVVAQMVMAVAQVMAVVVVEVQVVVVVVVVLVM